ncbi:protein D3-like [Brevipalpus obovatus]|uniref:protein D3-like n=1 Tax=Brevipalpus obovatus TaxID=246614 RepID=UPI003D9DF64E
MKNILRISVPLLSRANSCRFVSSVACVSSLVKFQQHSGLLTNRVHCNPFDFGKINCFSSMGGNTLQISQMNKDGIVPDVIDVVPQTVVEVKFSNGTEVKMGNELTPTQVKDQPSLVSWPTTPGSYYTLCMTDPDAPSRQDPKFREWHHWLVVNIPAGSPPDISKGKVLSQYVGSGPPEGTGNHRYVYLIYKQPGIIQPDETLRTNTSGEGRGNFKIRDFAQKYNLGQPIAGNFYVAQWDDYVPLLYKQLSGE